MIGKDIKDIIRSVNRSRTEKFRREGKEEGEYLWEEKRFFLHLPLDV